ncbi:MAG: PEGA domain-containing protein [Thermoanaerobaculum sp.]
MMRQTRFGLLLVGVGALVACASIIHGTRQSVGITSIPSAATVYDNGQLLGKTPMVAELSRKTDHRIRMELEGYEPYEMVLTRHVSGWLFGNLLFGGLIGIIIDAADGAIYNLKPEAVSANLVKVGDDQSQKSGLVISVVLGAPEHGERIGQLARLPEVSAAKGDLR